jgi:hypothetical protein
MTNELWPIQSRHAGVGDQEVDIQRQGQFIGRLPIIGLKHPVVLGPEGTNDHVQQGGLLVGYDDMSPWGEAWR